MPGGPSSAPAGLPEPVFALLSLPNELLSEILFYVSGHDLARFAQASRRCSALSSDSLLWHRLVSSLHISSPAPYKSFKHAYAALHRHLWLNGKFWFSDRRFSGFVLVGHYSSETGAIELIKLIAHKHGPASDTSYQPLSTDPSVHVSKFTPAVQRDDLLMRVNASSQPNDEGEIEYSTPSYGHTYNIMSSLIRVVAIPVELQVPSMALWPPRIIPALERGRNESQQSFSGQSHRPKSPEEAAQNLLRLRRWMRFGSISDMRGLSIRLEDYEIETFAALSSTLYTPNEEHPFRGLWVGDYSTHGAEIVLFHQPQPNRLEGIKITGDRNVPRGELTFTVPDLSNVARFATEEEWPGAKVVPAHGQIAHSDFREPGFLTCSLILISDNDVAMYWDFTEIGGEGHVSRFKRLDTNNLLFGEGLVDFRRSPPENHG